MIKNPTIEDSKFHPHIIFANQKYVKRINVEDKASVILSENHENIVAFDYNWKLNEFYWSIVNKGPRNTILTGTVVKDMEDFDTYPKDILRANVTKFTLHEVDQVDAIAVDWVTNNIYFGDKRGATIKVLCRNTLFVTTLAKKGDTEHGQIIGHPRGIALYQPQGILFFTDWSATTPHIGTVRTDKHSRFSLN